MALVVSKDVAGNLYIDREVKYHLTHFGKNNHISQSFSYENRNLET
jgi:hypothetical protein